MRKEVFYRRKFLNKRKGKALIETGLEVYGDPEDKNFDAILSITDCNRSVSLELWSRFKDKADVTNCLFKLDTLLDEIGNLRGRIQNELDKEE